MTYATATGVRASVLKAFAVSERHGAHYMTAAKPASAAMRFGSAVHAALLEPIEYENNWHESKGLKGGAHAVTFLKHEELVRDEYGPTAEPMAEGWLKRIEKIRKAIWQHPAAARLLDPEVYEGTNELELNWYDEALKIDGKAKMDRYLSGPNIIAELKTTSARDLGRFEARAADMYYHLQAAWYSRGIVASGTAEMPGFYFIMVTTDDPTEVVVCEPCDDMIREGWAMAEIAVKRYKRYNEGEAPRFQMPGVTPMGLPRWAQSGFEPVTDINERSHHELV